MQGRGSGDAGLCCRHLTEKGYLSICRTLGKTRAGMPGPAGAPKHGNYLSFGPGTTTRVDGDLSRTTENIAVYTLHPQEPELLYKPVTGA